MTEETPKSKTEQKLFGVGKQTFVYIYGIIELAFRRFCEGPQDAANGFPAILRAGVGRFEFQREPMAHEIHA
jgi:hypothetical protein